MRIAIDARGATRYRGTGIGTYTYQLVERLRELDVWNDYTLLVEPEPSGGVPADSPAPPRPFAPRLRRLEIAAGQREEEAREVARSVREAGFDLLHLPQNGLGLDPNLPGKVVVTVHDLIPYTLPQTCSPNYLTRFLGEMPRIVERADLILTVSHFSRGELVRLLDVPPEKIAVTHEAAEEVYRPQAPQSCRAVRERYGLQEPYILYVGGFSLRKNLLGLLHAFSMVADDLAGFVLFLPGSAGRQMDRLRQVASELGIGHRVGFPGSVPLRDLPGLYTAASVFVYPSLYEGFGLPVLEAMACGAPCAVARASSLPEVAGEAALYFDPHQAEDMALGLRRLAQDEALAERHRQRGNARAASFSWRATVLRTLLAYENLGSQKAR